ncbi:hypothetical protein Tph_c21620 [Thermacetogenium phaeum DSM 12270]|uniref:Uncharacterized protein n=1 Tax=Thermacetogenium phaeum (strain ATCC BAA-254 / DSM 26808 / PB) TaxID=1089553 RepID=K4LK82_THEPS|nr:hypothetical protein Tph_c21620 [Thermacetogenium phaeum DSM 12270]
MSGNGHTSRYGKGIYNLSSWAIPLSGMAFLQGVYPVSLVEFLSKGGDGKEGLEEPAPVAG